MISDLVIEYNGVKITDYFDLSEAPDRSLFGEFETAVEKRGNGNGDIFVSTRRGSKDISLPVFTNLDRAREAKDSLTKALNVTEPKRLWFSDEPDRYYSAVPAGNGNLKRALESITEYSGELSFLVPDGVAHATASKDFTFSPNSDGILETTIVNDGTDWTTVDYTITHNHENGFLGIVSEYGAIQLGRISEVDGVDDTKIVVLANNPKGNFDDWTDGTVFYENPNKKAVTTMTADTQYGGRLGVLPTSFTNTASGELFGAIKEKVFTTPATDWYLWAQAWYETTVMGQTGSWGLDIIDEDNRLIAGMSLDKTDSAGNTAKMRFNVGTSAGGARIIKEILFEPAYWENSNPYGGESRLKNRNPFDIRKEGSKITFFWRGGYYAFTLPELATKKAKRIQYFVGQYNGRTASQLMTHHYLNNLTFYDLKQQYWRDVPNRYPSGSVVYIDGKARKPYFNNMLRLSDEVIGSHYFKVPPGETKVQLVCSDFSTPLPTAKATIQEVFL
ncbi:distal tail protein Dit [Enterococcus asini]|uniref:distal tail protein Dit n=1 Tax=Enterococcus asini TaxID=57732 RepID=UPI001E60E809|nr:distal tail protein Dit [Enterococcus asini]MCD5028680.1 phage tail family protein [Enterococcus asini]